MKKFIRVGVDLAKNYFQVHALVSEGGPAVTRKLTRSKMHEFFSQIEPCLIGMEACGSAHYWARELEKNERERHGAIPGSLHAPYPDLQENLAAGGILHELAEATGKRILFYCAYGERSAMAVEAAQEAGIKTACHIEGGIGAWKKAKGPVAR